MSTMRTRTLPLLLLVATVLAVVPVAAAHAAIRGSSGCGKSAPTGTTARSIAVSGADRQYLLSIPDSYDPDEPAPLLFNFHGLASNKEQQDAYSRLSQEGGARGYVVITPDGEGDLVRRWALPPVAASDVDVAFVKAMLTTTRRTLCIDPKRAYAAGMSNGGIFATELACAMPGRFAAIAPVAGVNGAPVCDAGTPKVGVLAFHGSADPIVPYPGGDYFSGVLPPSMGRLQAQPVDDAVARWAALDGCGTPSSESWVADDVQRVTFPRCPPNGVVELYRVVGGGHTWPGGPPIGADRLGATTQSIDATNLMLDFFDTHPKAR